MSGLASVIVVCLVAALVYLILAALTGSGALALIGALLVLIAGIPAGGRLRR